MAISGYQLAKDIQMPATRVVGRLTASKPQVPQAIRRYVMRKYDLTPEEQEIEDQADEFVSVSGEERAKVESIIEHARRNRPVSLRMSEPDPE